MRTTSNMRTADLIAPNKSRLTSTSTTPFLTRSPDPWERAVKDNFGSLSSANLRRSSTSKRKWQTTREPWGDPTVAADSVRQSSLRLNNTTGTATQLGSSWVANRPCTPLLILPQKWPQSLVITAHLVFHKTNMTLETPLQMESQKWKIRM